MLIAYNSRATQLITTLEERIYIQPRFCSYFVQFPPDNLFTVKLRPFQTVFVELLHASLVLFSCIFKLIFRFTDCCNLMFLFCSISACCISRCDDVADAQRRGLVGFHGYRISTVNGHGRSVACSSWSSWRKRFTSSSPVWSQCFTSYFPARQRPSTHAHVSRRSTNDRLLKSYTT